jgi:DNA-binding IclR family transcriptional regulator
MAAVVRALPALVEGSCDAERRTTQSVDRGCVILAYVGEQQEAGVSLGDIARLLDVHKSTALRLLASFECSGLVQRDRLTGRYHLGLGIVALAGNLLGSLSILRISDPQLRRLAEATQQTVNLAVRYRNEILNVEQIPAPDVQRSPDWLGKRAPLHTGAAAKALLANLDAAVIDAYLRALDGTLRPPLLEALSTDLQEIRRRGFAINQGEVNPEVMAIGAPVFDASGECCASISIAWYQQDAPHGGAQARIAELASPLVQTAQTISRQLGHNVQHIAWLA